MRSKLSINKFAKASLLLTYHIWIVRNDISALLFYLRSIGFKTMNIHLAKHFEEYITDKINSGTSNNAIEVARAGLRALELQENHLEELRAEIE